MKPHYMKDQARLSRFGYDSIFLVSQQGLFACAVALYTHYFSFHFGDFNYGFLERPTSYFTILVILKTEKAV